LGIRGGAATLFYPIWHLEVESLLVLKNNRGVEDNRIRQLDYGVQINKLMYQRLIEDKDITLLSPHSVEGLYDAYFNDQELFEKLYLEAENNPLIPKKTIRATELFTLLMSERANTGRIYIMNVDHMNTHSSFIEKEATIYTSNLCVSGDTTVLTDKGMVKIGEHVGEKFTIWNGFEWSEDIEFVKTNTNQDLYRVELTDGRYLDCTSEHKWITYGKNKYNYVARNSVQRKPTKELKIGDWLQKWDSTVIDGNIELDKAYTNGFYTADGCDVGNANIIYFYHDKKRLFNKIVEEIGNDIISVRENENNDRISIRTKGLNSKYFVPDCSYTVKSRLEWFAGFMDGDGTVFSNDRTKILSFSSTNRDFCINVMDLLLSLGIRSRCNMATPERMHLLPDGKGGKKQYLCKALYRVIIPGQGISKLLDLGIKFNRLQISEDRRIPNRHATHLVRVKSITKLEGKHDTFCVFEPKNNSVIFNGILTGNCMEIGLPTKPLNNILDEEGEIALCTLGALNLGYVDKDNLDDIEESMDLIVRALDSVLDYQDYPVKAARNSVDKYRPLGIGVINYAYYLAKNGARYSNASGHKLTHELFEAIQYYALKSSAQLAKEKGKCKAFENTKYSKGILPIDTYKKSIDEFASFEYKLDWEGLRKEIVEHGLRNATLTSLMPSESSSQISNATNGIDLPRGPITVKASKDGILKQVVPEYDKLGYDYEYLWYDSSNMGMLRLVAIMQKFVDQSISTNTRYNPANYPNGKVPMKEMLKELLLAYKYGVKTLYYHHTNDGSDDTQDSLDDGCAGGACKI
jgi:ribonucleoside-diphosphate reductase alpha chain